MDGVGIKVSNINCIIEVESSANKLLIKGS
uniref:Uncharacterized protein n=1 Tax=Anguilla anguilla TaxID=7936 RepID=A0A0E9UPM6_ANGAN